MSILLHLETTTSTCSVCLSKDGNPWIVRELKDQQAHAEQITLFIQDVLKTANSQLQEIDAVAVSKGPGSYTGLRIGGSTAKGICYTLQKPLIAIDSLQALAAGARAEQKLSKTSMIYVSITDARRMDAYAGVYNAQLQALAEPFFCTLNPESFLDYLEKSGAQKICIAGDASEKFKELVAEDERFVFSTVVQPSARFMTALAQEAYLAEQFEDVAYFEPFYLKKPHITRAKPKF